jgi:lysyl-tRNA synthetase class II
MLEAYCAFGDYATMMETVESLITTVAQKVLGTLVIVQDRTAELSNALSEAKHFVQEKALTAYKEYINKTPSNDTIQYFTQEVQQCLQKLNVAEKKIRQDSIRSIAGEAHTALTHFLFDYIIKQGGNNLPGDQMLEIAEMFDRPKNLFLPLLNTEPKTIDLTPKWRRAKYKDLVREKAGANWFDISPAERRQRAHDLGAEIGKEYEDFEVTGAVFEKLIEPTLIQPTFVTHLPKELVPLAKLSPDDPTTVEVFECCINGQEISPGYTEQNDPIAQRTTLEHQAGGEQQKLDEDFLIALEHGMPPAGGIGIGIDRLCMMLLGQESIRDVILFPQLKPK